MLSDYPAFIKVKPHGDASFTSEISFYKQNTASAEIKRWIRSKEIQYDNLGIPRYLGSAQNVQIQNIPFDFLVLERYDLDLQTLLSQHHNLVPKPTVLKIAYHIVRVLEYFHRRGIVHGDVRACNIRMDLYDECIAYLLPQFHRSDESDRNAVAFWSEDRHCGAATKRGDFESLLYNLIDWSGGILPWKDAPPDEVKNMKSLAFKDTKHFLEDAFPTCKCDDPSGCLAASKCAVSGEPVFKCLQAIVKLMEQVAIMKKKYKRKPNYEVIKHIMKERLLNMYHVPESKLEFSIPTIIGDEDHEKSSRSRRTSIDSYVPGLEISTDVLATIIAENCSSFGDVNMFDSKPGGIVDVISQMKRTNGQYAAKSAIIRKAWKKNTLDLRTKVIELWRFKGVSPFHYRGNSLKGLEPGYYRVRNKEKTRQIVAKIAEKLASMKAKKKVVEVVDLESPVEVMDHESPAGVEDADERNCDTPAAPKDPNLDATNGHHSLQLTTQQTQKNGPDESAQKERSLSPSQICGSSSPSGLCQTLQDARSPSPSKTNGVQNPVSPAVSNGLLSPRSSQDDSHPDVSSSKMPEQFNEKVDRRLTADTVFETREEAERIGEKMIGQQRSVSMDDEQWHEAYAQLDAWLRVRERMLKVFGPISFDPHTVADQLQDLRVIRDEYSNPESIDRLSHLVNVLTGLSPDSADAQKLNRIQQRWLNQLAWLEESSRQLGDASFSQLHDVLQDSEILAWLVKELDGMPEKLTISTNCVVLQQQREHYQMAHQRVIDNEAKVVKLINDGHEVFKRSPNVKIGTVQRLFLDVMQYQWNRLKKCSFDIHNKLQNCDKYWQTQNVFLDWLSKTEDKLESLKPISLNNIEEVLKELSSLTDEACEKADEFAQMTKLGHIFVGVCDEDKDDQVKNDFNAVKDRWAKLNTDLLKRTQSLEIINRLVVSLNKNLHHLQQKIKLCEDALASYDTLEGAVEDPMLFDCTKEVKKEIVPLQISLGIVRQEIENLLSKTREERIDVSHLSDEMNRVTTRVESLNTKVFKSTIKILKQQFGILMTELQQAENYNYAILEIIGKKKVLKSKINWRFSNITDLEKMVPIVEKLGFPIDAAATRQQVELLSQKINRLEPRAQTHENGLKDASKNGEHSSNVNELMQKSEEKPSGEKRAASSDSDSSNDDNFTNNKKTESSKNKRKKHSSTSDSSPNENNTELSSKRRRRRSQSQDSNFHPSRPSTSNDNLQSHTNSIYDDFGSKSITSSNSSKTQNKSDSDLSPSTPKKSKHSKELDDYDSNLSLPRNDQSRQDTHSCHGETDYDSDSSSSTSSRQSSKRSRASSIALKYSDTEPSLIRWKSESRSNSPDDRKFDIERMLHEFYIKREIKKEPYEINESFHVEESCRMSRAIKLEPREINDSNVEEFGHDLPAIKAEPMSL